jgi:hypothetical protein
MVTVHVPLSQKRPETVAPYSAIAFDAHGGAFESAAFIDGQVAKARVRSAGFRPCSAKHGLKPALRTLWQPDDQ